MKMKYGLLLGVMLVLSLIPLGIDNVVAKTAPIPKTHASDAASGSSSSSSSASSSAGRGTFVTEWVMEGDTCKKKDVMGTPYLTRKDSQISPRASKTYSGYVILDRPAPEGKMWKAWVIKGEYGVALGEKHNQVISKPSCEISQTIIKQTSPMSFPPISEKVMF